MKKILLFLSILVQVACTSDDESDNSGKYYAEKAQNLAKKYGMYFEYTDPSNYTI